MTHTQPRSLVLQAYGTNRDLDVMEALSLAGAQAEGVPLNELRTGKKHFTDYEMLVLPGGFSYADALGAGLLLAIDLKAYFSEEIMSFVESGKPVIGICNGFQALIKAGVLPGIRAGSDQKRTEKRSARTSESKGPASNHAGPDESIHKVTLTFNKCGHFECRWIFMKPVSEICIWTKGLTGAITCPIAHGEGNFQAAHPDILSVLRSSDQVALTYMNTDGSHAGGEYPANPNGSILDIAGICNPQGNVLGLMPHPENHIHSWQHPRRTRDETQGSGLVLFENGVRYSRE